MQATFRPELLFEALFAFLKTGVLKAAVDLELFTHIARGSQTTAEIARAAAADERGVRIVLDALASQGFLTKDGSRYGLPPTVEMLLVKDSPAYAGDFTRITSNPRIWNAIGNLTEVVRTGRPAESMVEVPEHEFWVEFGEASERTSQIPAAMLAEMVPLDAAQPAEVLDVACGSGVYGFAVLERFPNARLTSLDWPNVLEQARPRAQRRGLAERVSWLGGSAFDVSLPVSRYDLVIASHFYHHFPPAQNIELSKRLLAALKPGGHVAVHDWVPDDARVERQQAVMFAVVMLASTPRGDVYTFAEYRSMLEAAGFVDVSERELPMIGSHVVLGRRP